MRTPLNSKLDWALDAVKRGWAVFPLEAVRDDGTCTCNDMPTPCPETRRGKHPRHNLAPHGFKDATRDVNKIREWWMLGNWNVGIATGDGLCVIDVDVKHNGGEEMDTWLTAAGVDLPPTYTVMTGTGGYHYYFTGNTKSRNGWLRGVDIKSIGGYVVGAGSRNHSGEYLLEDDVPVAVLPPEIAAAIAVTSRKGEVRVGTHTFRREIDWDAKLLLGIEEGQRNSTLLSYARMLYNKVDGSREIVDTYILRLGDVCGLAADEVERVLANAYQYWADDQGKDRTKERAEAREQARAQDWFPYTDEGNLARFVKRFGEVVRVRRDGEYMVWDGVHWRPDPHKVLVSDMAAATLRDIELEEPPGPLRKEWESWARSSQMVPRLDALMKRMSRSPILHTEMDEWDNDPFLFAAGNGTVDLRTGELLSPSAEVMCSRFSGVEFRGVGEPRPFWEQMLEWMFPDAETREWWQRCCGYMLTGRQSEKVFFILWGRGNNGKSSLLRGLEYAMGGYAGSVPKDVFIRSRFGAESHSEYKLGLLGKRLAYCGEEVGKRDVLNDSLIKSITGGDPIQMRGMRENSFEAVVHAKLVMVTNNMPAVDDFSAGLRERFRLIPVDAVIPRDRRLPLDEVNARLRAESSGILGWLVEGCLAYLERGLEPPESVAATAEDWLPEDSFAEWLREIELVPHDNQYGDRYEVSALFENWSAWCSARGVEDRVVGSVRRMKSTMLHYGFKVGTRRSSKIEILARIDPASRRT